MQATRCEALECQLEAALVDKAELRDALQVDLEECRACIRDVVRMCPE